MVLHENSTFLQSWLFSEQQVHHDRMLHSGTKHPQTSCAYRWRPTLKNLLENLHSGKYLQMFLLSQENLEIQNEIQWVPTFKFNNLRRLSTCADRWRIIIEYFPSFWSGHRPRPSGARRSWLLDSRVSNQDRGRPGSPSCSPLLGFSPSRRVLSRLHLWGCLRPRPLGSSRSGRWPATGPRSPAGCWWGPGSTTWRASYGCIRAARRSSCGGLVTTWAGIWKDLRTGTQRTPGGGWSSTTSGSWRDPAGTGTGTRTRTHRWAKAAAGWADKHGLSTVL